MSDDKEKVVFLAFDNKDLVPNYITLFDCSSCHNKTFTFTRDDATAYFPSVRCAACGLQLGHVGWVAE